MLQAEIIYLGGEKETYYKDAANEYIKRLGTFCSFSEKIIKDEKLPQNPSEKEISAALEKVTLKKRDKLEIKVGIVEQRASKFFVE